MIRNHRGVNKYLNGTRDTCGIMLISDVIWMESVCFDSRWQCRLSSLQLVGVKIVQILRQNTRLQLVLKFENDSASFLYSKYNRT